MSEDISSSFSILNSNPQSSLGTKSTTESTVRYDGTTYPDGQYNIAIRPNFLHGLPLRARPTRSEHPTRRGVGRLWVRFPGRGKLFIFGEREAFEPLKEPNHEQRGLVISIVLTEALWGRRMNFSQVRNGGLVHSHSWDQHRKG